METDSLLTKRQPNRIGELIDIEANPTITLTSTETMYSQSLSNQRVTTTEPTSSRSGQYLDDPFTINILLVGRSQVGKSTLIESLQDPTYSSRRNGISQTREPTYKRLKLIGGDKKEYTLNIIDTPGFQEIRHDPNETRTDQKLFDLLRTVLEDGRMSGLNMIGFVSVLGSTSQNDIDTFKSLIDFFGPQYKLISALILTHCDKVTDEKMKELTEQLKRHPKCAEVVNYCELGIHYHGTLDVDDLETYDVNLRERMRDFALNRLKPMRAELINFLLGRSYPRIELARKDLNNLKKKLVHPQSQSHSQPQPQPHQQQENDDFLCCQCKFCACRGYACEWWCWKCCFCYCFSCKCPKVED